MQFSPNSQKPYNLGYIDAREVFLRSIPFIWVSLKKVNIILYKTALIIWTKFGSVI